MHFPAPHYIDAGGKLVNVGGILCHFMPGEGKNPGNSGGSFCHCRHYPGILHFMDAEEVGLEPAGTLGGLRAVRSLVACAYAETERFACLVYPSDAADE